jgi:diguanylate cyclase (GGDEF)-like protein
MKIAHYLWLIIAALIPQICHSSSDIDYLTPSEQKWLSNQTHISVAFDGNFPPYSFMSDKGELEGFSIDVFDLLSQRLGVSFKSHTETTWKTIYPTAQRGEVDVVATMVNTPEREQWFNFTDPYIFKSLVIITQAHDYSIHRKQHLKNKRVVLVRGYQYTKRILEEFPSIKPIYVDDMLDALNAISTNKADATISFLGAGYYYRNKYLMSNLKFASIYDKKNSPESISVHKSKPELAKILNKALKTIPESEIIHLRAKWLPIEYLENLKEIELTQEEIKWIDEHPRIRLGIDPEFAPFEFMAAEEYQGMASDYVRLLNQRLNLNMQVTKGLSWKEVIKTSKQGSIDVLPAVDKTDARLKYLTYTQPYLNFHRVIVTQDKSSFIMGLDDIKNLKVATQAKTSHHHYLLKNTDIKPITFDTLEQSLLAVSGGDVDAFVGNVASATYWIRKLNLNNLRVAASVSDETQTLHFAVREDWPILVNILQKGLDSINEIQQKEITNKWLALSNPVMTDYTLVIQVVIISSIIIILILLWNYSLKRNIKKHMDILDHYSYHDQLTDLPNRFLMLDRFSQIISNQSGSMIAMLSVNIDDFKHINDTLGHKIGDRVLKNIASRLSNSIQAGSILGRLGGDQFLIILPHIQDEADAAISSKRILDNFDQPVKIDDHSLSISVRIGISLYPQDSKSPEVLLKNADSATHFSKTEGKGTYSFFTSNLNKLSARKLEIENHISSALTNNEFNVVYQPKIEFRTNRIVSFEALLRWNNPTLGNISPNEFIPIIEENGEIENVGLFVLYEALNNLKKWNTRFNTQFSMAVNLSPRQFRSPNLINQINLALEQSGNDGSALELEITEGVLLENSPEIESSFKKLQAMGVKLSLDDFGKGYSSMSYLRKFKFDILKIDYEFTNSLLTDKNSLSIVSAIIAMAHNLNMEIVAEGIEEIEQYNVLKSLHCTLGQGFLLGRPMSVDTVEQRIMDDLNKK